jgi:molybdopterin-containing oxidoreductase family membrane subunit
MHNGASQNGHGAVMTPTAIGDDLFDKGKLRGKKFRNTVIILGILTLLGIIGFALRVIDTIGDGTHNTPIWGYHAALFAFILTAAQGAPMVAIAPRIAKAHWRRSISRIAELFGLVGVVSFLIYIPVAWVLPSMEDGRRTLWFYGELKVPAHMPEVTTTLVLLALTITGLVLLWVSAMPDFAMLRDRTTGSKQRWFAWLARGWIGSSKQWHWQKHRLGIVGAFYFMMLITAHFAYSVDFGMTLVPGWIDALYPATHAHNSLQSGVAITLIAMYVLYRFGGYKDYITLDQFWGLGKLLFALSLLWFWFWFSSFIIFWFGAKPAEEAVLDLLFVGPYLWIVFIVFIFAFFVPLWSMIWNPLRKSVWGPVTIASGVLVATMFDKIRLYVAAFSVSDLPNKHELVDILPGAVMPGVPDVLIWVGGISACILIYMLATRIIPPINVWEQKEVTLYRIHKPFHRTEVQILGKPD